MSYEMTSGLLWPDELVHGEYPSRGREAVEENDRTHALLEEGWEPFAVVPNAQPPFEATQIWFRRKKP